MVGLEDSTHPTFAQAPRMGLHSRLFPVILFLLSIFSWRGSTGKADLHRWGFQLGRHAVIPVR